MQGRCSGCAYEASSRLVFKHQRGCEGFAELYRRDPALALVNPVDVYAVAHVVAQASPEEASPDPLLEIGTEVVRRARRVRESKPASVTSARVAGPVSVEYWDWQPTILEELQLEV